MLISLILFRDFPKPLRDRGEDFLNLLESHDLWLKRQMNDNIGLNISLPGIILLLNKFFIEGEIFSVVY